MKEDYFPDRPPKPDLYRDPETVYRGFNYGSYHSNEIRAEGELLESRTDLEAVPSSEGFIWGYGGAGPYVTSLSLLADAYDSDEAALDYAMTFKNQYVWPELELGKNFEITARDIDEVVESIHDNWDEIVGR